MTLSKRASVPIIKETVKVNIYTYKYHFFIFVYIIEYKYSLTMSTLIVLNIEIIKKTLYLQLLDDENNEKERHL